MLAGQQGPMIKRPASTFAISFLFVGAAALVLRIPSRTGDRGLDSTRAPAPNVSTIGSPQATSNALVATPAKPWPDGKDSLVPNATSLPKTTYGRPNRAVATSSQNSGMRESALADRPGSFRVERAAGRWRSAAGLNPNAGSLGAPTEPAKGRLDPGPRASRDRSR